MSFIPRNTQLKKHRNQDIVYNPSTAFVWLNPFFPLTISILKRDTWGKKFPDMSSNHRAPECLFTCDENFCFKNKYVAKTKITLLWNEIKIRISIVEREIVNKLSIFLITRKKLNVNPRMLAIRFVMKEKKTMNLFLPTKSLDEFQFARPSGGKNTKDNHFESSNLTLIFY